MKLFLDDQRTVPHFWGDEWTLCRTVDEAKMFVAKARDAGDDITAMSLDHDLGTEETRDDFVKWICEQRVVPPIIGLHSANPVGVKNMASKFQSYSKVIDDSIKVVIYDYLSTLLNGREDFSLSPEEGEEP